MRILGEALLLNWLYEFKILDCVSVRTMSKRFIDRWYRMLDRPFDPRGQFYILPALTGGMILSFGIIGLLTTTPNRLWFFLVTVAIAASLFACAWLIYRLEDDLFDDDEEKR